MTVKPIETALNILSWIGLYPINTLHNFPWPHSWMEKAMATHSSTLAWKIPWMEEPGGLQSMGSRLSDFPFTFHFHALEKEMATHSSVLAWRIPGPAEPGRLPSMGLHRVGHDWSNLAAAAATSSTCMALQWSLLCSKPQCFHLFHHTACQHSNVC